MIPTMYSATQKRKKEKERETERKREKIEKEREKGMIRRFHWKVGKFRGRAVSVLEDDHDRR